MTTLELGWMDAEVAQTVRAEGERVIRRIEERGPPFCERWPEWRPRPSLPPLSIPDGWDAPP